MKYLFIQGLVNSVSDDIIMNVGSNDNTIKAIEGVVEVIKTASEENTCLQTAVKKSRVGHRRFKRGMELLPADAMFTQALTNVGLTPQRAAEMMLELCNHKSVKVDKNGNMYEEIDGTLKFKVLELWTKVVGAQAAKKSESASITAKMNLTKASDEEIERLHREFNSLRGSKKKSQ